MDIRKIHDVFNAGGEPTVTYIKRDNHTKKLEEKISDELYSSKIIIIHGPSKLGKTVITKKVFSELEHIWVDGGTAKNALGLWDTIIMDADDKFNTNRFQSRTDENAQIIGVNILKNKKLPLVIDDFHLMPEDEQKKIIQSVKSLVFNAIPIVLISVPHKLVDVVNAEREMNSRNIDIEIPTWEIEELEQIAIEGFKKLELNNDKTMIDNFIRNSFGSPFIMQELCYKATIASNESDFSAGKVTNPLVKTSERMFYGEIAESYCTDEFNWVLNGSKSHSTSRKEVEKTNGSKIDIFQAVTTGISMSKIDKPIIYLELKKNIMAILKDEPDNSRITYVLNKMTSLAKTLSSSSDVIRDPILEWDTDSKILYLIDPFLKFYIKWSGKY
ncbi:hypothetical protein [Arcobacter sp. YIC-310]|uniref:hypothetical protein n=1 Tax=Arcobacter sp. YIC-310 TaxID=3376632 RepID=UPI003C2A1398